ncbi:MAG: hypothetical protein M1831_003613 [Alyxoria varia]|nr:MAG: hypothetical protein M1831_003613 [Alyxoria varia]
MALLELPNELLFEISSYLILPELQNFSNARLQFTRIARKRLELHVQLKKKWRCLERQSFVHRMTWHPILRDVVKQDFPIEYIEEVRTGSVQIGRERNPVFVNPEDREDLELIRKAVSESSWIRDTPPSFGLRVDHFVYCIEYGCQDHALAVLLPLLPNLRRLAIPPGFSDIGTLKALPDMLVAVRYLQTFGKQGPEQSHKTFQSVTYHQDHQRQVGDRAQNVSEEAVSRQSCERPASGAVSESLPLQNLTQFQVLGDRMDYQRTDGSIRSFAPNTINIDSLVPYMTLPSIQRIKLTKWRNLDSCWPCDAPRAQAKEMVFEDCHMEKDTAIKLAKGVKGPCTITNKLSGSTYVVKRDYGESSYVVEGSRRFSKKNRSAWNSWNQSEREVAWKTLIIPFEDARAEDWLWEH